ncbi:MAG: hypothetical protein FWG30_11560 [Eubacteriaceae bacterium]|nr:hypothetical protein [Eubacteriaceae bacterium]
MDYQKFIESKKLLSKDSGFDISKMEGERIMALFGTDSDNKPINISGEHATVYLTVYPSGMLGTGSEGEPTNDTVTDTLKPAIEAILKEALEPYEEPEGVNAIATLNSLGWTFKHGDLWEAPEPAKETWTNFAKASLQEVWEKSRDTNWSEFQDWALRNWQI